MRILLFIAALLLLSGTSPRAQEGPRWMDEQAHATPSDTALRFTTSGNALSVLFNGFITEAAGDAWWAAVTRTATFSARPEGLALPFPVSFTQHLRGSIHKDADARVVVVLVLPDRTETLVVPFGERVSDNSLFRTFRSSLRMLELQEYAVSAFVRIDRRRPSAQARFELDSFDVTMRAR